jgi:tetratricopeptide (TPR) repeat protein
MAKEHADDAPTKNMEALYQVYLGMGQYYKGDYTEAIETFNLIDLTRLNVVYHILIFAHLGYAAFELGDEATLESTIERMHNLEPRVSKRYKGILFGYLEVLESTRDMREDPEHYREIIEKHFENDDGYIATKLNYHYRMALYYKVKNFTKEMDEHLAFVIANGGQHHSKQQALKLFQDSVDPEDYVYDPEADNDDEDLLPGEMDKEEPLTLEGDVTSEEVVDEDDDEEKDDQ